MNEYIELNKLYEIQVLQNKHKKGAEIYDIARELNKDKQLVYNQFYKYYKKGLVKLFGLKKNKKVIITESGINRIVWTRQKKGEFVLRRF